MGGTVQVDRGQKRRETKQDHCYLYPTQRVDSSQQVPAMVEQEGNSLNDKPDDETIVMKDGKRYKKRAQLPPLGELLRHGDKSVSETSPRERYLDFLFGPLLLAVAFFLSFLFWSHFIMKGPRIVTPGMDLMNRVNNMKTMKQQMQRAKELHKRNQGNEDL